MGNKIYLGNDGLIHGVYSGDQTYETIAQGTKQFTRLIEKVRSEGKPALILVDLANVGRQDSKARKAGVDGFLSMKYDKIAMFGGSPFLRNVANLIVKAIGRTEGVKFFRGQEEAVGWLRS